MKIIIVGAGIIGASIAAHLAPHADVTILEAGQPGQTATGATFGWINASFYLSPEHFKLREAGIQAHRGLGLSGYNWSGALCWDCEGDSFDKQFDELVQLGYPVKVLTRDKVAAMEPALDNVPERILSFPTEGAVDAQRLTHGFLTQAASNGAKLWTGCRVLTLLRDGEKVTGVKTPFGELSADLVIVASGVASSGLLPDHAKLKHRPALVLRTQAQPELISQIMVSPEGEFRQLSNGQLIMPLAVGHQNDQSDGITGDPDDLADAAMDRLRHYLPKLEGSWAEVTYAERPVPEDDVPIIGPAAEGAYVAVLHSGITLAAITGKLVAQEITGGQMDPLLAPFRPRVST